MKREGISLGWNCSAAQEGLYLGLRKGKSDGYNTCPFDMMISNYIGLCECIKDDFKYLYIFFIYVCFLYYISSYF